MLKRQRQIIKHYKKVAKQYDGASLVTQEIGKRLLERFEFMTFSPKTVLDLGSGTLFLSTFLQATFPEAYIIAYDISFEMLKQSSVQKVDKICGDMHHIALKENQFDCIVLNAVLPFAISPELLFRECHRLLAPGGLLLFTTAGPDSLQQISHPYKFEDMHNLGDLLLYNHFNDPMMDKEILKMTYHQHDTLVNDLRNLGIPVLRSSKKPLELSFEVVYGMAWGSEKTPKSIPIASEI